MSKNDRQLLDQILAERTKVAPDWTDSEYFELFAARQVLRTFPLEIDDVESGLVGDSTASSGKGSDGGIDGFYVIVNGRVIRNPSEAKALKVLKQNITLDLVVIQASTEASFDLKRINRLEDTLMEIFDLNCSSNDFSEQYNDGLLNGIDTFRTAHKTLLSKGFTFNVSYCYCTKGDVPQPDDLLARKARALEKSSTEQLATITKCIFNFVGAAEAVQLAVKPPKSRYTLVCDTSPMMPKDGGLVALVKLKDYLRFISHDQTGDLLDHLFDSNVRDYQGDIDVNLKIRDTLEHPGNEEFWWLNNGITVLASKADPAQGDLAIEDPQIVNGLQTSMELYEYFRRERDNAKSGDKKLLVKVIVSQDSDIQDKVINATNSQTGISPASIWATDPIQRNIETIFKNSGLSYDRRKHYWRNRGIPLNQIVGISELAQAVAAIFLQEPDHARARPARYFKKKGKDKELYGKVFNKDYPITFYPACAILKKRVAEFLRKTVIERRHRANLLHYVLMVVGAKATGAKQPSIQQISKIKKAQITEELLKGALDVVQPLYKKLGSNDKVAKGSKLVKLVKAAL